MDASFLSGSVYCMYSTNRYHRMEGISPKWKTRISLGSKRIVL